MSQHERAFYVLDRELRLINASPNTLAIWGKSLREVVGRKLVDVFPFVEGGPTHEGLLLALQTFRPVRLQTESVLLNKLVEVEIYPVADGLQVSFAPLKDGLRK
jgi:hypothetical protein